MKISQPTIVDDLSPEEFKKLLTMIVESERITHGRLKTATSMTMGLWLEVLDRTRTVESFTERISTPFKWEQLVVELRMSAIVACCYMRVIRESHNHHGA